MQRHLQESWTAECVLNHAELPGGWARVGPLEPRSRHLLKAGFMAGSNVIGRIAKEWVKTHVVVGRVKAWMVKYIERLHIESKIEPLLKSEVLEDGHIDSSLEGTTEYVSSCVAEPRFVN